jgi:hypothetical protein
MDRQRFDMARKMEEKKKKIEEAKMNKDELSARDDAKKY